MFNQRLPFVGDPGTVGLTDTVTFPPPPSTPAAVALAKNSASETLERSDFARFIPPALIPSYNLSEFAVRSKKISPRAPDFLSRKSVSRGIILTASKTGIFAI